MRCLRGNLIALAVLLLAVTCVGQAHFRLTTIREGSFGQAPVGSVNTNEEPMLPHIYLWWHDADTLTQGTNVAITNWLDRIQQWVWTNETAGTRPTTSTNGLHFNGTDQFLTNIVPVDLHAAIPSAYAAVFAVLKWIPDANVSPVPFGYEIGANSAFNWFHIGDWAWNFSYGPPSLGCSITAPVVTNTLMTIASFNTLTNEFFFTNGILCKLGSCYGGPRFNYMGKLPSAWHFQGYIRDLIVYTNIVDGSYITNLQHYASTNYGVPLWP